MAAEKILIVEDDETLRNVMQLQLKKLGYEVASVPDVERAMDILQRFPQNLIITDLNLPGISGIELLKRIRSESVGSAVIVMTAYGTIQSAVEAMRYGAYDYITKPIEPYDLKALVSRALDHQRLIEEVQVLRSCLDQKYGFENIIGSSSALMRALDVAARVAPTDATVLIRGETGTGKELVAKAMHFQSARRDRPFVTINCAAIPRELLESELFGYMKGAFTGALTHKKGKAEIADGGTMLLDEIGEMPMELQVRVLRLIQEREIEKIGARTPTKVDVRIIAATHRNLEAMVKDGVFREDLYYRLLVVPIELPPLRERRSDIPDLVWHFLEKAKRKHNRSDVMLNSDLLPIFSNYSWPGNVRQLGNAIERMVLLSGGPEITYKDLPDFLQVGGPSNVAPNVELPDEGINLDAVEKDLIMRALERFGGNQTRAANFLNMSRRTLAYRLKKYNVQTKSLKAHKHGVG
jgi:two-component system, NtrC family, response regulator